MNKSVLRDEDDERFEPMTVYQAIRASKRGIAQRRNRHTQREEFAMRTGDGVRIIKSITDPTVVRKLPLSQQLTMGWTPFDPRKGLDLPVIDPSDMGGDP